VLARTNARLEPIARGLEAAGIPYRMAAGSTPSVGWRGVLAQLRRLPAGLALRGAMAEMVVRRETERHADPDGADAPRPAAARGALPAALARLADEHALEFPGATVGDFLEWLAAGGDGEVDLDPADGVELSTFHRAKGLEWPAVAVVGLEDGMVPIAYALTPDALAEERRLLYVALTRAEDELWCSWARTRRAGDRTWRCRPSPLLAAVEEASTADRPSTDTRLLVSRVASLRARLPDAV
jgi:DNA helicase-2/ATP-dependent DNA helicase PcrA